MALLRALLAWGDGPQTGRDRSSVAAARKQHSQLKRSRAACEMRLRQKKRGLLVSLIKMMVHIQLASVVDSMVTAFGLCTMRRRRTHNAEKGV